MSQTLTPVERNAFFPGEPTRDEVRMAPGPVVHSHGMTHPGKVRPTNEDQFLIAVLGRALQVQQTSLGHPKTRYSRDRAYVFAVADGMGGHAGGERASALAIYSLEDFMLDALGRVLDCDGKEREEVLAQFRRVLGLTDERVCAEGRDHPELYGMGTTLTLAYSCAEALYVVHVGDSRCYLWREGRLLQITRDHTMAQELFRAGLVDAATAARHQWRHVITNAVGGREPGVQPEVHKAQVQPGDCLLLCSDGLTEMVPDEELAAVLQAEPDPRQACERLIERANAHGGRDNITVIVARYSENPANAEKDE